MKKYLLPQTGNFYKANLHCHSTISDGSLTPEEIKKIYSDKGYSVVAYTDHDILLDKQHLTDKNFLALNGFEVEINEKSPVTSALKNVVTYALWHFLPTILLCRVITQA